MNALSPSSERLVAGTRIKVVKGCRKLEIVKGVFATVKETQLLGADYSHQVRVSFQVMNGFHSGKTFVLYARHENRLSDPVVRMNNGNPAHMIEVVRV